MSIRNLDFLLDPRSVAVIGASSREARVGTTVWRNLRAGQFAGPVFAVNPKYRELDGQVVAPRVADLPQVPDLAVICTPADSVAGLIAELGALGTKAAIVLTAGLSAQQQTQVRAAAQPHLLRVLGPNCIGLLSPHIGLNASFAHTDALAGDIAFVSQSGALTTALLDWARADGIGFSHFVSLGEKWDVDFGDMLDYLANDPKTRSILLYIESVSAAPKFMSAARAAARNKPVIVVKAGRSASGQKAAASHTGALAGSDAVYDAAIARAGMLRVGSLQQLFLAAETLARFRTNTHDELTILTNGGGAGVLAADAASQCGVVLADLDAATLKALDQVLPTNWSRGNPIDIIGDAPIERYIQALQALDASPAGAAVLMIHAPTAIVPSAQIATGLVEWASRTGAPRLMTCWLGEQAVQAAKQTCRDHAIATYQTPEEAVQAFSFGVTYRRNQAILLETPGVSTEAAPCDLSSVRAIVQAALAAGRPLLSEFEAKQVLTAFGVPTVPTQWVELDPPSAAECAQAMGFPVVLKIVSPDLSHKSDVGGVVLNLENAESVHQAAKGMMERLKQTHPQAHLSGFTVQAMIHRPQAFELIVGASVDAVFGPVILFGHGGTAVEVIADRAIALPPLNRSLAHDLVRRTRVFKQLSGYRDVPAVKLDAVYQVLEGVSRLMAAVPELAELDINPLLADAHGVMALDARIRLDPTGPGGAAHFSILPYPAELVQTVVWQGRQLCLRPIRPDDEAQHRAFLARLSPEDIRMRVFYSRRSIEHSELARLTQIDYAREMAFVAVEQLPDGQAQTLGAVRATTDPDHVEAEFGIIVRSDLKRLGLGQLLMQKMVQYLRAQGTQRMVGTVLAENHSMLDLCRELGFTLAPVDASADTRVVQLDLQA